MFGKLMPGSGGAISKDINESVKTLSYLARAEKYFDLELKKNGQMTKPLLRIVDVIEPLRKIFVLSQKLEKSTRPEQFEVDALDSSEEIIDVVNDILSLSPKGLVSSDKVVLAKLGGHLNELRKLTNKAPMTPQFTEEPKPVKERSNKAYSGKLFGQKIAVREEEQVAVDNDQEIEIPDSFFQYDTNTPEPAYQPQVASTPEPYIDNRPQINDENFWTSDKLDQPLEWDRPGGNMHVNEAAVEHAAPQVQEYFESGVHEPAPPLDTHLTQNIHQQPTPITQEPVMEPSPPTEWMPPPAAVMHEPTPTQTPTPFVNQHVFGETLVSRQPAPTESWEPPPTPAPVARQSLPSHEPITEPADPYNLSQPKSYNLPQKYFATSYAGMNLQEAAEIINDLNSNPKHRDIVLMEHSSSVKPIDLGGGIISDLLAIAPIADSFETGSEISDKSHLAVLKNADRIISICRDIANVKIEGFDKRKQKLFEKFLPNDIRKTLELAKVAYPEFFSSADLKGEITSNALLDFSDIIIEFAAETGDKLFAELISQIVVQIALYAEHNDLRLKFDLVTKKNKLNSETQGLESRSEIAALRSVTFVPKIARHAQDVLSADTITDKQNDTVDKALEILQLIYMHARDNYSAEMQSFYRNNN